MTENGVDADAAASHEEKVKIVNTSAYDSITEVLSHGIRNFLAVDEFFTAKVNKKPHSSSYPWALFDYAKTGPCNDAYNLRTDILNEIYAKKPIIRAYELLEELDARQEEEGCRDECSNIRSMELFELSQDKSIWKEYYLLQTVLDRYFARNRSMKVGPLFCINVETFYERFYVTRGCNHIEDMFHARHTRIVKTSLNELPSRLEIQDSSYDLYGVVERIPGEKDEKQHHYVGYCRDPNDGRWERRDGFEGEKKKLTELSVNAIALIFYARIRHWDEDERKVMFEPAKPAWYKLTNVYLPDLCVEKIFSFLDNRQLQYLIRASLEEEEPHRDFTCPSGDAEEDEDSKFLFSCRSNEHFEQWRRLHNVIIYNLPFIDDDSDVDSVKKLFDGICGVDLDNIHVQRSKSLLGGQPPLTIVTFQSHAEAKNIMTSKKLFPEGIKIGRDYTKWQRKRFKKLMAIAEKHNKSNPHAPKIVRYIDGIPSLVNKKKNYFQNTKNLSEQFYFD